MTIAWYVAGGLAAAATAKVLAARRERAAQPKVDWQALGELGYLRS